MSGSYLSYFCLPVLTDEDSSNKYIVNFILRKKFPTPKWSDVRVYFITLYILTRIESLEVSLKLIQKRKKKTERLETKLNVCITIKICKRNEVYRIVSKMLDLIHFFSRPIYFLNIVFLLLISFFKVGIL